MRHFGQVTAPPPVTQAVRLFLHPLALGDAFFFQSLVSVGARLGSLLMSLALIFGSVIAWVFFGGFHPFQANAIRMITATIVIWIWTLFEGKAIATFSISREKPNAVRLLALGALTGPVLGVSSSLLSVQMRRSAWQARSWLQQKAIHFSVDISP